MQLHQLRHLLALHEHRSLARGAQALGISQPALSKSLRRLEAYLGVKLFERTSRGVLPTEFGRALALHARSIAVEVREAERAIGAIRDGIEGRIAVGSAPSVIAHVLPIATGRLLRRHADLKVTVIGGLHDRLFEWLRNGEIDVVISNLVEDGEEADFRQETLYTDRVVVAARPGHPLARGGKHSRQELAKYRWVLPSQTIVTRQHLELLLKTHGLPPPVVAIETNALAFMRAMLMETDCLGYLPAIVLQPGRECSGLEPLGLSWLDWDRPVGLTVRRSGILSPACERLIQELRRVSRESFKASQLPVRHKPRRGLKVAASDMHGLI
ncbi:MAG: LysR family transcriptional regulator [Alphaproteobacteria bacterium]|nr:LysR family transcriptional regulator [Alphaproteobacteria bacterium]